MSAPVGEDERRIAETLELAALADHRSSPNPMVGALVVADGRVVGRGHTAPAGGAHAEVTALDQAGAAARGATLYVSLEPCAHRGRTPPCTRAIIAAAPRRCVVSMIDPNPKVDGAGVAALRAAGIEVTVGVHEQRARRLNRFYERWVRTGLPYLTAKYAISLDGRIATHSGESKWITGELARARVHELRHQHDVILVGATTVARDDPNLTTRLRDREGRQPLRVVLDSRLRVPVGARIFADNPERTLVATSERARGERVRQYQAAGIPLEVFASHDGRVPLHAVLRSLGRREHISVLCEGGSQVLGSAFDDALVDAVSVFVAPRIIGGADAPGPVGGAGVAALASSSGVDDLVVERLGVDLLVSGVVCGGQAAAR